MVPSPAMTTSTVPCATRTIGARMPRCAIARAMEARRPRGPAHWVAAANEPVRLWQQMGAFETAADCARARGQLRAAADGKWGDAKDDVGSVASALLSAAVTARCVPGDHLDPSTTK